MCPCSWTISTTRLKLENNCDFSGNNNVWTWSYAFLTAILNFVCYFYYGRLIEILFIVFFQPFCIGNLDFRIRTSNTNSEVGSTNSEVGSTNDEVGSVNSEVVSQNSKVGSTNSKVETTNSKVRSIMRNATPLTFTKPL